MQATLQRIKDTSIAAQVAQEEEEEFVKTLMALSESPEKEPDEHHAEEEKDRNSKLPKYDGGYLRINHNTWIPR